MDMEMEQERHLLSLCSHFLWRGSPQVPTAGVEANNPLKGVWMEVAQRTNYSIILWSEVHWEWDKPWPYKPDRKVWRFVLHAMLWALWGVRNHHIFRMGSRSEEAIVDFVCARVKEWVAMLSHIISNIVRLLANHPFFHIALMTADRKAGQSIGSVFPHLITQVCSFTFCLSTPFVILNELPDMVAISDADFSNIDAVFCCLPHATTQEIIKGLPKEMKIVDLSADFRLRNVGEYEEWYGQPHRAPELQKEAVYGLTEVYREEIQKARLVANPGCYPTSILLPLVPLLKGHLIGLNNIIIDAKSGVSGAGRGAKEANLYTEVAEGIHSYGITKHRHVPEIEQGLSDATQSKVTISFTPHLMPMVKLLCSLLLLPSVSQLWRTLMSRGMQSTIYVELLPGVTVDDLYSQLHNIYRDEEFVKLLNKGSVPHTRHIRGSNYCFVNIFEDRIPGRAIIISVVSEHLSFYSGNFCVSSESFFICSASFP
ncbi:hypothetical protein Taro_050068 [Colocasia esculenta]|uniref:Semialdehyde dehydrogenase NAD-binding domain-containing protein n=1 Tax=Colocasia esculenta TaxID=4460 RepID=A0A843XCG4_COLES|nr:hypothetical protein [Colocasia esculenta]